VWPPPPGDGRLDTVAARKRREDEGHDLQPWVARAGSATKMHMLVEERLEAQSLGEGGRQQQAGVGHDVTFGEAY